MKGVIRDIWKAVFLYWLKDMGGLDEFWMDNETSRAQFFIARKDYFEIMLSWSNHLKIQNLNSHKKAYLVWFMVVLVPIAIFIWVYVCFKSVLIATISYIIPHAITEPRAFSPQIDLAPLTCERIDAIEFCRFDARSPFNSWSASLDCKHLQRCETR